ncbi:hypothetical protein AHAS_Ahas10G0096300 [Arachis hypogaea]
MTARIKDTTNKAAISTKDILNKEAISTKGVATIIKVGVTIPTHDPWRDNYQQGGRDSGGNQRWNNNNSQNRYSQIQPYPQQNQGRNYQTYQSPHQRQPPQPNQPQAPQITYPSTSPNQDDTLRTIL